MQAKRLIIPKPVYEALPLFYLCLGISCLVGNVSTGLDIIGGLLIARALFTAILRINYRSPHQALTKSPVPRRGP